MAANSVKVAVDAVRDKWSKWSSELCNGLKASIESLVCSELILGHTTTPETLTVKTYVPVTQVLANELLDSTRCRGWVVVLECLGHTSSE